MDQKGNVFFRIVSFIAQMFQISKKLQNNIGYHVIQKKIDFEKEKIKQGMNNEQKKKKKRES